MIKIFFPLFLCVCLSFCTKNKAALPSVPEVAALNDVFAQVSSDPAAGSMFDGTLYLSYSGGNGAAFEAGNNVSSTGVTGLTAILQKGQLEKGMGTLTYKLSGVPVSAGVAIFELSFGGKTTTVNINVAGTSVANHLYWGFFDDSGTPMSFYDGFEKKPSMAMMFDGWNAEGSKNFPIEFCRNAEAGGYLPHVTWEPMMGLSELISGKYDNDIKKYGEAIASFGKPVILRFAHEFNGDWYPWSIMNEQLIPASTYVTAFRYVHEKIREAGGLNAYWVWAPNVENGAKNQQTIESYYPGDAYVDLIGMDGYNFGTSQSFSRWQSFTDIFENLYNKVTTAYPHKPVFISEMGCSSTGGDKAAWIADMFIQLENKFPKINSFVWFNINKETDWRFTETQAITDAFKTGINSDRVLSDATLGLFNNTGRGSNNAN
ncbi:MAG: glycosyl hydrolase [Niabella sp.]